MIDFILGLFLAALLVRGWLRGFVREVLDLVGLIVGLWIAFIFSRPFGDFLTTSFGVTPEVARIGAGIALFVLFGIALNVAAHFLAKVMALPGLNMVNRLGGAAVAVGWGITLTLVLLNVARVLPLPETWQEEFDDSSVAQAIAGPEALPQRTFERLAGDSVLVALASIQELFGTSRAVPEQGEVLNIPTAASDEIRQVRDEADEIVSEINRFRTGRGLRPLVPSDGITMVAEQRATESYVSGMLFRDPECSANLTRAGVRTAFCEELVALAGTALGALQGMEESGSGNAELRSPEYDRLGVSVVDGPTGRLLMVVLGG